MIEYLKSMYRNQMFYPNWMGLFVNPFYFARKGLMDGVSSQASFLTGKLLDVGCGSKPYQSFFKVETYIGLDIDNETNRVRGYADIFYDGGIFPFEENAFDCVICCQVLEHVFNPDDFLREIFRVVKPGGKLLLTVPFVWDEHEKPYDYARYSSFGLRHLLKKQGFEIVFHSKLGADASTLFQLINAYLYKVTLKLPRPLLIIFTVVVMAMINLLGVVASYLLPKNPDLYLDHLILAKK